MDSAFPPSPQWHQAHSACLCCLSEETGWLLYTLNNSIHILNPFTLKYQGALQRGHSARINALASRPIPPRKSASQEVQDKKKLTSSEITSLEVSLSPLLPGRQDSQDMRSTGESKSLSQGVTRALVASGGDDSKVVCWDILTRQVVATLTKVHQKVVRAVEWSGDGRHIISGDRGGLVAVWDPFQGKSNQKTLPEKPSISCISASPTRPDVVAIGLDGGDILMCQVNMSCITILSRLHGHTDKIQSLAWQPSVMDSQEYTHLASGSADQTIRVWDIENMVSTKMIRMPEVDNKLAPHLKSRIWVPVGWTLRGQDIISCTSRGTMIRCSLERDSSTFGKIMRGKVHNRNVFQIMTWPFGSFAFTFSMDRKVIAWDLESGEGIAQIECIGGNVYALDISTLDPGRLAMGLGNEAIKVWNTLSDEAPYDSVTVERLQSKVRAVKWHPVEEGTLCFGLENGKIGKIERVFGPVTGNGQSSSMNQQGKKSKKGQASKHHHQHHHQTQTIFQSYHERAVVSMIWCSPKVFEAPVPELFDLSLRDSTYCVISCGSDGRIFITDSSKPTQRSLDLEVVLQRQNAGWYQSYRVIRGVETIERRDVAVHPNEDLLAIGNADGSVEVFELKYFKLVYVYQGHKVRVNRVKWNWSATGGSDKSTGDIGSSGSYLLASGSDDGAVAVHKLDQFSARAIEERRHKDRQQQQQQQAAEGGQQSIVALTESDFSPLSSPSAPSISSSSMVDSSTIVPTMQALAYFKYHYRGVSDIAWSPHEDDEVGSFSARTQKLVTASYDGKAIVYQIQAGRVREGDDDDNNLPSTRENSDVPGPLSPHRPIACFAGHENQVLSVHWSLSEVDTVYSGGNDWRACSWDWKAHKVSAAEMDELRRNGAGLSQSQSQSQQKETKKTTPKSQQGTVLKDNKIQETALSAGSTKVALTLSVGADNDTDTEVRLVGVEGIKRMGDYEEPLPLQTPVQITKRAKIGHQNSEQSSSKSMTGGGGAMVAKRFNLFPMSTAAFQVQSKQKVHLEIIRLTRNLYCRRVRQGGVLISEDEHRAAKRRWRAMRQFFEEDGEKEGQELSRMLKADMDEMNLADDDDEDDEDDEDIEDKEVEMDENNKNGRVDDRDKITIHTRAHDTTVRKQNGTLDIEECISMDADVHMAEDVNPSESWHSDDSTASIGDLVFYGSRESVKALAEMEAQDMSAVGPESQSHPQHHHHQHHHHYQHIFAVGSGMGVPTILVPGQKEPTATTSSARKTTGQKKLCQVPISCWMGDVPKVMDILGSAPVSELGIQDWIGLALSPMGGAEAWRTMMAKMAIKLEGRGEVHMAVLCYLGIGRVIEAVEAYLKQGMYREALMLLRIRLWDEDDGDDEEDDSEVNQVEDTSDSPSSDMDSLYQELSPSVGSVAIAEQQQRPPVGSGGGGGGGEGNDPRRLHIRILTEWGQQLERRGHYEQACKCQLTLASLLTRTSVRKRQRYKDANSIDKGDAQTDPTKAKEAHTLLQATSSVGLQTLARRSDPATLRTAAGLAILLDDHSKQQRINQYQIAIAQKREADRTRKRLISSSSDTA
ncbi:Gem-associated protein 5 [Mortierella sp. GBA30]|nr:Gem-associated protein 5 [Mortierella sp. GBA30]